MVEKNIAMRIWSVNSISFKEIIILYMVVLAPIGGSLTTLFACSIGLIYMMLLITKNQKRICRQSLLIGIIYLVYIGYFLILGFLYSGFSVTLTSMAPNLPILMLAFVALGFDWSNVSITSKQIGKASSLGAFFAIILSTTVYCFPIKESFFGFDAMDHIHVYKRLSFLIGNPLLFASLLVAVSFFGLLGYAEKSSWERFVSFMTIILCGIVVSFWSQSRGAMLTYFALLLPSIFYLRGYFFTDLFRSRYILLSLILIFLLGLVLVPKISFIDQFLVTAEKSFDRIYAAFYQLITPNHNDGILVDYSTRLRLEFYEKGFLAFLERPLFGYDQSNIFSAVKNTSELLENLKFSHLHNSFLNHLVAGGMIGAFFFMIIILLPIFILLTTNDKNSDNLLFCALILTHSIFSGLTNLYFNNDLLSSFNGTLPLLFLLSILGDQKSINKVSGSEILLDR